MSGADRLGKSNMRIALFNRALVWHLQTGLKLCDLAGYSRVSLHLSQAIDALITTAVTDEELSSLDLAQSPEVQHLVEAFLQSGSPPSSNPKTSDHLSPQTLGKPKS